MIANPFALGFLFSIETIVFSLLAFLLFSFYQGFGRRYVKYWMLSLLCLSIQHVAMASQQFLIGYADTSPVQILMTSVVQTARYLFLLLLCIGAYFTAEANVLKPVTIKLLFATSILVGVLSSVGFAFDEAIVFSRFYLRETLADFIFAGAYFAMSMMLLNINKRHFSAKILMYFSFVMVARYLICSFFSITFLAEPWFQQTLALLHYFDFGAYATLGFVMLLWMQGAERNAADRAINRAQYLGKHDQLTGVLNREQVIEKLQGVIDSATKTNQRLAIYLIDIKRFKFVNDTYGLKTGDLILGEIAKRLSTSILLPHVVGRLSGDSFVYTVDISNDSQQDNAASHLHDVISHPYLVNHHEVHIQCSIGYCVAPSDGTVAEELLKQANLALFQAETNNQPSVKYVSGMQAQGRHLLEAETEIRQALENKEFILFFQPQLNLLTNRIDGVEALIRWQHPTKGIIEPSQFLPDFDALGLNGDLDNYVLELACKTNDNWYKKYKRRVTIAINITAVEFQDPQLITKMQRLIKTHNVPPSSIELEITENVVITDLDVAMNTIVVLQNMGIKVSIDDFGTGYSSLAYLRRLPIDKIKIDRSFITEFANNDSDLMIVKSMIKLSHGLGKRVLAEGVESEVQLNLLRKLGCDAVQGYFINRPLPEETFIKYLNRK